MSLQEEKELVLRLRSQGLTLQAIAHRLGKSIYWVNSRLNEQYEPTRTRTTAKDEPGVPEDAEIIDPSLADEYQEIVRLREKGYTFQQIAAHYNRSLYWVHSRLRGRYRPRRSRTEKVFQEQRVVPYLVQQGHAIDGQYVRIGEGSYAQEADVVSTLDGQQCITEVKVKIIGHQLQTAIGQLVLHRHAFAALGQQNILFQIALPMEAAEERLEPTIRAFLEQVMDIRTLLVP